MSHWNRDQIAPQQGQTVIVTGANSGIGFHTASGLAAAGAHVVMACRDTEKAAAAAEKILDTHPNAAVAIATLDLADLSSVNTFADDFLGHHKQLDLLINNAGVMAFPQRRATADGFEMQFGTNHLGHFALTARLMPALLASPAPRVVSVSSIAHKKGSIHFNDLNWQQEYQSWPAYNQSKLANLMFALELHRRSQLAGSKLISVAAHPGVAKTNIVANGPGSSGLKALILNLFSGIIMQPDWQGALPVLYAATETGLNGGEYIGPDGPMEFRGWPTLVKPAPQALDEVAALQLWDVSESLTGVTFPPLA
jgi:NAD(P)-dependent dehydrogenase (short-subunit alcohol dehydrogenase family)